MTRRLVPCGQNKKLSGMCPLQDTLARSAFSTHLCDWQHEEMPFVLRSFFTSSREMWFYKDIWWRAACKIHWKQNVECESREMVTHGQRSGNVVKSSKVILTNSRYGWLKERLIFDWCFLVLEEILSRWTSKSKPKQGKGGRGRQE